MRKYIGTKQVEAEPMTMGAAFIEGFFTERQNSIRGRKE
jgi:hypothetical protein